MLQYLHVKNLALIDEIEVEFQDGLNILTGETEPESRSSWDRSILRWAPDITKKS